uniref:Ig-like domain-containing protein n=1 Tax=Lates calcarifer TaxID=8187 RepID=A0A4W6F6A1_LATCA
MEVKPGADVLLQCQGPRDADIRLLKWSRPDLESEGYVYFFRDNHLYEDIQHPSFHGRVKLRDPHMKDEDFSVTLKNVIVNDTGRYECEIINSKTGGKPELISTINLKVEPGELVESRFRGVCFCSSVITYLTLIPHTCFYSSKCASMRGHRGPFNLCGDQTFAWFSSPDCGPGCVMSQFSAVTQR